MTRACKKSSDRNNTRLDALLRDVRAAENVEGQREARRRISDSFSYFGNILQQDMSEWRKKHLTKTVIEHRVQSTDLTHGPSIWVDDGGSFCKIPKTLQNICQAFERETNSSFVRQPRFAFVHRGIRVLQTEWKDCSVISCTMRT